MTSNYGIIYVAYGYPARNEAIKSIATLWKYNDDISVALVSDTPLSLPDVQFIKFTDPGFGARWAKLNIDRLAPWDTVGYLDADTRVRESLQPAFDIIGNGYDLAIAPSINQYGQQFFHHIGQKEKETTLEEIKNPYPLQLQAGMMFFHRRRCAKLFATWREEWQRWKQQDQAALVRALMREPVRLWLLGLPWNRADGEVVNHLFGRARG